MKEIKLRISDAQNQLLLDYQDQYKKLTGKKMPKEEIVLRCIDEVVVGLTKEVAKKVSEWEKKRNEAEKVKELV